MKEPTAFGMNGNNLMVGGEAGAEAILPLEQFYTRLNNMLDNKLRTIQNNQNVIVEAHTYIDGDEVASKTETRVNESIANAFKKRR